MLGAIYGDLAAATYIEDKELFYKRLIGDHASLSEYGETIMYLSRLYYDNLFISWTQLYQELDRYRIGRKLGGKLMQGIVYAWFAETEYDLNEHACYDERYQDTKDEFYAMKHLMRIIYLLRNGFTKDETYQLIGEEFKYARHHYLWWSDTEEHRLECYVLRAWDAFYNSFDYGSALHNATKMAGDVRLNCVLSGAVADAMYGCGYYYKKLKYCLNEDKFCHLSLPKPLATKFESQLKAIRKQREWVKVFFPKNDAMTNVERHRFTSVENPFANKRITKELRRRILKAFQTGWECRYGFYLDNGWIYVYRSYFINARFQLKQISDEEYRIVNLQRCDDSSDVICGIEEGALYTVEHNWEREAGWHFKYFSPYYNQDEVCPDKYKNTVKANFWHGEMMFYHNVMSQAVKWIENGKTILYNRKNPKLYFSAKELGPENFGIVYYIEELFLKWCPYDDVDWIAEY
jgi:hypothetical protein